MKQFTTTKKGIVCIPTESFRNMENATVSPKHYVSEAITIHDDEDCVFGSLDFFLSDNDDIKNRRKKFFRY